MTPPKDIVGPLSRCCKRPIKQHMVGDRGSYTQVECSACNKVCGILSSANGGRGVLIPDSQQPGTAPIINKAAPSPKADQKDLIGIVKELQKTCEMFQDGVIACDERFDDLQLGLKKNNRLLWNIAQALLDRDERVKQLEVQLAGCTVAAKGYATGKNDAKQGDYGYSQSFQDVKELREKLKIAVEALEEARTKEFPQDTIDGALSRIKSL